MADQATGRFTIDGNVVHASVGKAAGVKCPRCGHYHRVEDNFDNLCDRCCHVLIEDHPDFWAVPHIKEAYARQRIKWNVNTPP